MRRAFTLVELLVVVAVIALLVGILIPALSSARHAAHTANCLANLRTLETAQAAYAAATDGKLIDAGYAHGGVYVNEQGSWIATLEEVYKAPIVRRCPADRSPHWSRDDDGDGAPIPGGDPSAPERFRKSSYGVNNYLTSLAPGDIYERVARIPKPASTVQFLEIAETGEFAGSDHPHVENWAVPGLPPESAPLLAANEVEINQHGPAKAGRTFNARANWGFLDGHAATLEFREVFQSVEVNSFDPEVMR